MGPCSSGRQGAQVFVAVGGQWDGLCLWTRSSGTVGVCRSVAMGERRLWK